ncbi:MAG: hypothetical protein M5R41_02775 [Bacteroidia bacterium]|nr:hypothetical protein [Bacteroidia bacterium]
MKRTAIASLLVLLSLPVLFGCQPIVSEDNDNWITYEVRQSLDYNDAWMVVVDGLLTRGYQFETLAKDDGYMKSEWLHETVESQGVEVRTRISVKFTYGRKTVRIKVDEDYIIGYKEPGIDIPRVADLKVELRDRLL